MAAFWPHAAQAVVTAADPVPVGYDYQYFEAGTQNNVVVRIPITASGSDTLTKITINNNYHSGIWADEPTDIVPGSVRLWYVPADSGFFSTSTAQSVAVFNHPRAAEWSLSGLTQTVQNGSALYVTIDITQTPTQNPSKDPQLYAVCGFVIYTSNIEFGPSNPFPASDSPSTPPLILISDLFPAYRVEAEHSNTGQIMLSTGQTFVPMQLTLSNPDLNWPLTPQAPVLLSGITLTVRNAGGVLIAPNTALDQLGLRDLTSGVFSLVSSLPSSAAPVFIPLSMTIAAADVGRFELFGTVASNTATVVSSFRLDWTAAADLAAADAYTFAPVPVIPAGDSFPMQSNLFSISYAARQCQIYHTPMMAPNEVVLKGQTNVNPLNFTFLNPGNTNTARIDITRLTLAVTDASGTTLSPAAVFSRLAVGGGILYGETMDIPSDGSLVTVTLASSFCSVPIYQAVTVSVLADIRPDAAASGFRISLPNALAVRAQDANSLKTVPVVNWSAADPFPMVSEPVRIASSLAVISASLAPKTLYPGQRTGMLSLTFTHPGPSDLGTLVLHGLTLTAHDRENRPVEWATNVSGIFLMDPGYATLAQTVPANGPATAYLALPDLALAPFSSTTLRLEILASESPKSQTLALGLSDRNAVAVSQPSDQSRPVFVSGAWPMFSAASSVGGGEGRLRLSNYPNPFAAGRQETLIAYHLENHSHVTAKLYTLAGDQVQTLCRDALQLAGENVLAWDGRTSGGAVVVNGVYLLRLESIPVSNGETMVQIRKIAVVK